LAVSGCGLFDGDSKLQVESSLPVEYRTTFTVYNGALQHVFTTDEMALRAVPNYRTRTVMVEKGRSLRVAFVVTRSATDTVSSGELEMPTRDDFEYSIHLQKSPVGEGLTCFGCNGHKEFPLVGSEASSGFAIKVSWSAMKPCRDCVY
jgi:hypothetical protein